MRYSFPDLEPVYFSMSSSNCCFLTCIQFLRRQARWSDIPIRSITKNKASGDYGIPVELFQILKDEAVKVLHSICQQIWKTHQWPQGWKRSVFIPIPKRGYAKDCSTYCAFVLISHTCKLMLKILQARLQQYANCEFPNV